MGILSLIKTLLTPVPRIKTFDLACEYLKEVNWQYIQHDFKVGEPVILARLAKYLADPRNQTSNEYYRSVVFEVAVWHCLEVGTDNKSAFDEAVRIIKKYQEAPALLIHKYENTIYPNVMVQDFNKYCASVQPMPDYLSDKFEVKMMIFGVAYHYALDRIS